MENFTFCAVYAYQIVRNVSFTENFAYVINGWPLMTMRHLAGIACCQFSYKQTPYQTMRFENCCK